MIGLFFAYWCEPCNLLFWLHEDSVHPANELHFSSAFQSTKISCPRCRHYHTLRREDLNDKEVV